MNEDGADGVCFNLSVVLGIQYVHTDKYSDCKDLSKLVFERGKEMSRATYIDIIVGMLYVDVFVYCS